MAQAGLHLGVGDLLQVALDVRNRAERCQTLLRVVVVLLEVFLHQRLQQGVSLGSERLLAHEDGAEGLAFVQHPGVHGGDELVAVDEIQLQGEDAVQQVQVGGVLGHGDNPRGQEMGAGKHLTRPGSQERQKITAFDSAR